MVFTEKGTVEDYVLQELEGKLDWTFVGQAEMEARRGEDLAEPLVVTDVRRALRKINDVELSDADLDFILVNLKTIPATIDGIRRFIDYMKNGLVVPLEKEKEEKVIRLIDFDDVDTNDFIVTNQYRINGIRGNIRADIVLLVNGIPLVLIEAKNPAKEQADWLEAYKQIKRYEDQAPDLFKYVQFSIATDGIKTRYFPNAFEEEGKDFIGVWKDPYPFATREFKGDILKVTLYGMLSRPNITNLLENYIFVRKNRDKANKVITRYMQFRASDKIFNRVIETLSGKGKNGKFGLIWHWQGSGKTYTMAFSAWRLLHAPAAESPSVFVMVDRKDLEEQILRDFAFLQIPIERINTIKKLIEVLQWGKEGKRGIFLITIEKFSPQEFADLEKSSGKIEIGRQNVIVLADEVHRTHYGKFGTLMRSVFRNAFIFGFTGTPLSKMERNTFQKFCPKGELYLDRYSMLDAQDDGFTVPISYTARLPQYHLNGKQLEMLSQFQEEEISELSPEEQRELARKVSPIREILKDRKKIREIAKDIAEHFQNVVEPTELKAMLVTIDREACVLFKEALDQFVPPGYSEVVMTPDQNKSIIRGYFEKLHAKFKTKDDREIIDKIKEDFLSKKEPKILIVTDMLITGFDAPILWAMYMHKPLKEHRVLQAVARTNRPFQNKKFGMIVDYIGILDDLESAYGSFEASDAMELKVVFRNLEKEYLAFKKLLDSALEIFTGIRRENTHQSLEAALNRLLDPETARKFESIIRDLMRSYEMLKGEAFLRESLEAYSWLIKPYIAYNKKYKKRNVDELRVERLSKKTKQLIQGTIDIKEIEQKYPTLEIDDNYLKTLKKLAPKSIGAAIDIATNLAHEITLHPTSPFFINLSKEVEDTYERLRTRKIETEEGIEKLMTACERVAGWKREMKEVGADKYPVYEAVKFVLPDADKARIIDFADDLKTHLRGKKLIFKGWQLQRDVRRKVRQEIRIRVYARFKDHKAKVNDLTERIFAALEGFE
jgi:type I restriction enzyme R subunit